MGAKYSIIQYLPDARADERINIGVIVMEGNTVKVRFLEDWRRVECFAAQEIGFLKEFGQQIKDAIDPESTIPGLPRPWTLNVEEILHISECWQNSIQVSKPVGSVLTADALLSRIATQYLKERHRETRILHDKNYAIKTIEDPLKLALEERLGKKGPQLVHRHIPIDGDKFSHELDIGISRARTVFAGSYGISFEISDRDAAFQYARNAAVAIDDIRRRNDSLPIGVLLLPPIKRSEETDKSYVKRQEVYDLAKKDLRKVGAHLLTEQQTDTWAYSVAAFVPRTLSLEDEE